MSTFNGDFTFADTILPRNIPLLKVNKWTVGEPSSLGAFITQVDANTPAGQTPEYTGKALSNFLMEHTNDHRDPAPFLMALLWRYILYTKIPSIFIEGTYNEINDNMSVTSNYFAPYVKELIKCVDVEFTNPEDSVSSLIYIEQHRQNTFNISTTSQYIPYPQAAWLSALHALTHDGDYLKFNTITTSRDFNTQIQTLYQKVAQSLEREMSYLVLANTPIAVSPYVKYSVQWAIDNMPDSVNIPAYVEAGVLTPK